MNGFHFREITELKLRVTLLERTVEKLTNDNIRIDPNAQLCEYVQGERWESQQKTHD